MPFVQLQGVVGRVPFRYMVDQLSRSDARADRDDTVSIDGSSNGTVPEKLEYPHHPSDHHDDTETQTLSASEDLTSGFDLKQVYSSKYFHCENIIAVLSLLCFGLLAQTAGLRLMTAFLYIIINFIMLLNYH